jgi:hypothetical protein
MWLRIWWWKKKFSLYVTKIWVWVQTWKKKLNLDMLKYDFEYNHEKKKLNLKMTKNKFEYNHEKKNSIWTWWNVSLSTIMKEKFEFKHDQIWLWVYLLKEKLTLDMFKYNFEYVCQRKTWL